MKVLDEQGLSYLLSKLDSRYDVSGKVDKVDGKGLSTNDYTTTEKNKLAGIAAGAEVNVQSDWNQTNSAADDYIKNKPTIPTVNNNTIIILKNNTSVDSFTLNQSSNKTINITVPTKTSDLTNDSGYITDISGKADSSAAIGSISLSMDSNTYKISITGTKVNGTAFTVSDVIDLPLESVVVSGSYDSTNKKVVLTLKSGSTVEFSVADLISGLQSEITTTNKLSSDLIDDTGKIHKFVTASDISTWNGKQDALVFNTTYDATTNKVATMSDIPSSLSVQGNPVKQVVVPIQEGNDTNVSETIINTRASIDGAFVLLLGEKVSGTIVDIILFGNGFMSHPTCEYRGDCYYIYHLMSNNKLSKLLYAVISFYGNSLAIEEEPAWVIKYKSSTTYPLTSSLKNTGFYIGAIGDGSGHLLNSIGQTTIRDWHYITALGSFSISIEPNLVCRVTADELYIPCGAFTNPVFESCNISKLIFTASSVYFPSISSSSFGNCTIGSIYVSDSLVDLWKSALGSDYSSKIYPISEL